MQGDERSTNPKPENEPKPEHPKPEGPKLPEPDLDKIILITKGTGNTTETKTRKEEK